VYLFYLIIGILYAELVAGVVRKLPNGAEIAEKGLPAEAIPEGFQLSAASQARI
jgi:hypothetical protein